MGRRSLRQAPVDDGPLCPLVASGNSPGTDRVGEPYQYGRRERLCLTLEEVVGTPSAGPRAQQRAVDLRGRDDNEIRLRDAPGMPRPRENAHVLDEELLVMLS